MVIIKSKYYRTQFVELHNVNVKRWYQYSNSKYYITICFLYVTTVCVQELYKNDTCGSIFLKILFKSNSWQAHEWCGNLLHKYSDDWQVHVVMKKVIRNEIFALAVCFVSDKHLVTKRIFFYSWNVSVCVVLDCVLLEYAGMREHSYCLAYNKRRCSILECTLGDKRGMMQRLACSR